MEVIMKNLHLEEIKEYQKNNPYRTLKIFPAYSTRLPNDHPRYLMCIGWVSPIIFLEEVERFCIDNTTTTPPPVFIDIRQRYCYLGDTSKPYKQRHILFTAKYDSKHPKVTYIDYPTILSPIFKTRKLIP